MTEPVAAALKRRLGELGWNQADLAHVLGWSVQAVSDLLKGRRTLDARGAMELARALEDDPLTWLARQAEHELWLAQQDATASESLDAIEQRRRVELRLPVRELVKRGLLPPEPGDAQVAAACQLLEIGDISEPTPFPIRTRRASGATAVTRQQVAWIACARKAAHAERVGRLDVRGLGALGAQLSRIVQKPEDLESLPENYAEVGVRLVHVEPMPGGRIDGVSTLVDGTPVIALSGRGGRLDKILFTLAHETAHVAQGHLRTDHTLYVSDPDADPGDPLESEADQVASTWLVPDLERLRHGLVTGQRVEAVAAEQGISQAVVIGRLQKEKIIPWNSTLNKRIPSAVEAIRMWH